MVFNIPACEMKLSIVRILKFYQTLLIHQQIFKDQILGVNCGDRVFDLLELGQQLYMS